MARVALKDPYGWSKLKYQLKEKFGRYIRHGIFNAIELGDEEKAIHLATQQVLLRARDEWGSSPLVAAIAAQRPRLVREYIQRGGMFAGDGAMAHASMRGNLDIVEMLLAAKKDPNEPLPRGGHNDGYTPLMWATNRKFISVIKALLAGGADVDAVAADGCTAVMLTAAAQPSDLEALDILRSYKPDIAKKDWRGRNLIREARDREKNSGKPELRRILERHFPNVDFDAA